MKRSVAVVVLGALLVAPQAFAYRPRPVSDIVRSVRLTATRIASNGRQLAAVGGGFVQLYSENGIAADAPIALPVGFYNPDIIWSGERYVIVASPGYETREVEVVTVTPDGDVEVQAPIPLPVPSDFGTTRLYSDGRNVLAAIAPNFSAVRRFLLDAHGRLLEKEPKIDERAFRTCSNAVEACSANGSRVLSLRSEFIDGKTWRLVTTVRAGDTIVRTSATEVRDYIRTLALEPDGDGWRAIGSSYVDGGIARFDADGNLLSYGSRVACCTNSFDPAAVWIGQNGFLLWMDSLFDLTEGGAVHANARGVPDQTALSLVSTGDSHFATWVEDGHLRGAWLDRSGAFLNGRGIDFGPPSLGRAAAYDTLSTLRFLGWNGRSVAVPNGPRFILLPIADVNAANQLQLDFESSTAAWNGTEWGIAGSSFDGSLVFARISADGRLIEKRIVAPAQPRPGILFQAHREPALMWDGVQYILVWIRHDFHATTSVNPPFGYQDDRALLRLRLDRNGVPLDAYPYALDFTVDESPVVATNGGDDVIAWSRNGSVEVARFAAAARGRTPKRLSAGQGHAVAVAASGASFVATWLHDGMDHVSRRHIVRLQDDRPTQLALITPGAYESVLDESAIDARLAGMVQRSDEVDHAWRAGVTEFGDGRAPLRPPPVVTATDAPGRYQVLLRWTADPAALFFTIERRNESGVFGEIAIVAAGTERIGGGPSADYRVRAWSSAGKSLPSNVVSH